MSQVYIPLSIEEALSLLSVPGRIPCAGATNLYVDRYFGKYLDMDMISLHKLAQLKNISQDQYGWHIGSMCTFDQLESYFAKIPSMEALSIASSLVGGPQVRNRGTIGGNIISASPSADTVPVLMAMNAKVILKSMEGERILALKDFMVGVKRTAIKPEELLTEILVPPTNGIGYFQKVGKRNALAISICNACVYGFTEDGILKELSIAIGSCAPTCVRASKTENTLIGKTKPADEDGWKAIKNEIKEALQDDIHPIDDVRAKASYRRKVSINIIYDMIRKIWEA